MLDYTAVASAAALFFILVGLLVWGKADYGKTKEGFLLSYRDVPTWTAAITIGIGWMWAPAFFISSFQAYTNGLVGTFWFSLGNVLTLILFGFGISKIVQHYMPRGYTFTGYIRETYGPGLHKVYIVAMVVISLVAITQLLVALSKTLSIVSGVNPLYISIGCILSVYLLSYRIGFRASVYADLIKFVAVYGIFGALLTYLVFQGATPNFAGVKGTGLELMGTPFAWTMFATFGAATTLSLLSTPWVDNSFTQQAYAMNDSRKIAWAFTFGSLVFAGGIALTSFIGYLGASKGVQVPKGNELYTLVYIVDQMIGRWALVPVVFVVFAGLMAVIDTFMVSISSIVGHDMAQAYRWDEKKSLQASRLSFMIVGGITVAVANSGVDLLYLFLLGSVIKSSIGLATAALVFRPDLFRASAVAPVILTSVLSALVLYIGCAYLKVPDYQLWLAVGFCFGTPLLALLGSRIVAGTERIQT